MLCTVFTDRMCFALCGARTQISLSYGQNLILVVIKSASYHSLGRNGDTLIIVEFFIIKSHLLCLKMLMRSCIPVCHLRGPGFRKISREHGHTITKGALKRLSHTNPSEIGPRVSTSASTNFHAFSIPFRMSDGPAPFPLFSHLIQRSSLRRIKNVLSSVVRETLDLISRYTINRVLLRFRSCDMTIFP